MCVLRSVALALALGMATASPLDGSLQWIQQNGEEVMETTTHCVEAAQMARELQGKCGQIFDPEALASVAGASWGFLETVHPLRSHDALAQLDNLTASLHLLRRDVHGIEQPRLREM